MPNKIGLLGKGTDFISDSIPLSGVKILTKNGNLFRYISQTYMDVHQ